MKRKLGWILFGVCLVLPRILRILDSDVQIEDPNYIYGAFLLLKGLLPFAEFAQVNPPLLETILAFLYKIFGVSHRVPEILSALAYLGSALLIYRIGRHTSSKTAGITASILYSWHFLLFRYHLFERETFATLAVLLGLEFLTRKEQTPWTAMAAGLIMGFGFACKQTALFPFAITATFIALCQWKWSRAIKFTLGFTGFTALIILGYSAAFGSLFLEQNFWFHWIKGFVAPWNIKAVWTLGAVGFLCPAAIASIPSLRSIKTDWNWLWCFLIGIDLFFFWFVSGAFWPHYLIATIPFAALLSGHFISQFIKTIQDLREFQGQKSRPYPASHKSALIRFCFSTCLFLACIVYMQLAQPGSLTGKETAKQYGFSGTPRIDVQRAARAIRENTSPDDLIISDPFIALEAQRIKVVRFKDNWGLILWMKQMMARGEYRQAVKKLSRERFGDVRRKSHDYWMPLIETAFAEGKVGAIQPNYELQMEPEKLLEMGYRIAHRNNNYIIWCRQ